MTKIFTNNDFSGNDSTRNSNGYSALSQKPSGFRCIQDIRLLRTCAQVYHEARSVLYRESTFVFDDLHTFAAYFGIDLPDSMIEYPAHISRSTDPDRLRTIQAMTRVELRGIVGERSSLLRRLEFLSATRVIRTGLGCLTNLVSLELSLRIDDNNAVRQSWMIDDCMFSKPTSLCKLLIDVQYFRWILERVKAVQQMVELSMGLTEEQKQRIASEKPNFDAAKALLYRILKQDGFSDTTESFWRILETTTPTDFQTETVNGDGGPTARLGQAE